MQSSCKFQASSQKKNTKLCKHTRTSKAIWSFGSVETSVAFFALEKKIHQVDNILLEFNNDSYNALRTHLALTLEKEPNDTKDFTEIQFQNTRVMSLLRLKSSSVLRSHQAVWWSTSHCTRDGSVWSTWVPR